MTNLSLTTGLKALLSAQYVLDTIGHNIANANTPGYSRQGVHLGSSLPLDRSGLRIGSGVDASSVQRSVDALLGRRILSQISVGGGLLARSNVMGEVETLLREPDGGGLGQLLDGFFSSVSELSTAPEDPILRTAAVQSLVTATSQFNDLARAGGRVGRDVADELQARVSRVNELAAQVAALNVQIGETEAGGVPANDLNDRRDQAVRELAELVDVTTVRGPNGSVAVLVAGNTLVSSAKANQMAVVSDPDGRPAIAIRGSTGFVPVRGGAMGGLFDALDSLGPALTDRLDTLARNLILEVNRVHSTGIPAGGPFTSLVGEYAVRDVDGDGRRRDELLANAGLPFDVSNGSLTVNVTDRATGAITKHTIDVRATHTTVGDFVDALNGLPSLSADLDAAGRVRIVADAGHGFDFSRRLDPHPAAQGTFGGGMASLGTLDGPFALADGDTLDLTVDAGGSPASFQLTFASADFAEISAASAAEVAAAINASAGAQANGVRAVASEGRLFLQSLATGADASFTVDGGPAAAALGWSAQVGTPITGSDDAALVTIGGNYTGTGDDVFTFTPTGDGVIGTTDGLAVEVRDADGSLVATLDVGVGYTPGTELAIADGVTASFGLGELSASENDFFALDLVADSDTSDVLVALGLNALLVGTDAASIGVRADVEKDPSRLASSLDGSPGDSRALLDLLGVQSRDLTGLGGRTLGGAWGELVSDIGFDVSSTVSALDANDSLVQSLEQRRDQVSGVNVDEELVDLLNYEQAFAAAAQYITVVNQLGEELLSLI